MRAIRIGAVAALIGVTVLTASCGTGGEDAMHDIQVLGISGDNIQACVPSEAIVEGLNFLSEHGAIVDITFEAAEGTPFERGTSSLVTVQGTVIDNETIQLTTPVAIGNVTATITVQLPDGASATSLPGIAELLGGNLGPPAANADVHQTIGNVQLVVDAANGVLINDQAGGCQEEEEDEQVLDKPEDGSTRSSHLSVVAFDAMSVMGGEVNVNPDGSFTYNPPVGYEGPDTFEYTMTDGNETAIGLVTIGVQEMVWFINDQAPAGGDGRFTSPLNSLMAFSNIQPPSDMGVDETPQDEDYIFVYYGSGNTYDGGVRLLNRQRLVGEATGLTVLGTPLVPAGQRPTITNSGITAGTIVFVPVVVLADANLVTGVRISQGSEGILGTFVAGPTQIFDVVIENTQSHGISLFGATGTHAIGDPAGAAGNVSISNAGFHGIQIDGAIVTPQVSAATVGPNVDVSNTSINVASIGINCLNSDLSVDTSSIVGTRTDGISFLNNSFSLCTISVTNSTIGTRADIVEGFGIRIQGSSGSDVDAVVNNNDVVSDFIALQFFHIPTTPNADVVASFSDNSLETLANLVDGEGAIPTVNGVRSIVMTMNNNTVVGNGSGGGMFFETCVFDADGDPGNGITQVQAGGITQFGMADAERVLETAFQFFSCDGDLLIADWRVFQLFGVSAGFFTVGGTLTFAATASAIDSAP